MVLYTIVVDVNIVLRKIEKLNHQNPGGRPQVTRKKMPVTVADLEASTQLS
jgi:hypothetical protein